MFAPEDLQGKSGLELLAMGTKAFRSNKFADAVAVLSKSSELLVEEHRDDKHNTLGNVYLYYGKSLLELTREESDPLGDAVPKEVGVEVEGEEELEDNGERFEPSSSEEDADGNDVENGDGAKLANGTCEGRENGHVDKEAGEKAEDEDNAANETADNMDAETVSDSKPEALEETTGDNKTEKDCEAKDGEKASDIETADCEKIEDDDAEEVELTDENAKDVGEGTSTEKPEEEPTDLQLAWEVLELAKIIFERRGEEGKEDYADCLVTLGEVSLENEDFDSAIADIKAGLEIQKQMYTNPIDKRKLAQTYYKLGLALTAHNKVEEGIENYHTAVNILSERLKELETISEPGPSDSLDIKDIRVIIPELEEKIADLKTYKEEVAKKMSEDAAAAAANAAIAASPEKKANDISHLVKRKRKIDEVAADTAESAAKKKMV